MTEGTEYWSSDLLAKEEARLRSSGTYLASAIR